MKKILLSAVLIAMSYTATAQNVGINESGAAPDASAVLDVQSSDKGVLFPRLTTIERDAIQNPANSLTIFNTTSECLEIYNASESAWRRFGCTSDCGENMIDVRDGKIYKTIKIGNQCWMAENLNYTPQSPAPTNSWCIDCTTYGRLYDWNTAMAGSGSSSANPSNVQGVCPMGWHLPSDAEWTSLVSAVGSNPGNALKTSSWDGNNSSGFTALPGGYRILNGSFTIAGSYGFWWSTTESGSDAWLRSLYSSMAYVYHSSGAKGFGFSVRCVKGAAVPCSTAAAPTTTPASNIAQTAFDANWQAVSGATTYYLDVSDDVNFNNLIVNDQNVGNVTTYSVSSGLTCNTAYYYRVRAENACGVGANSSTETLTTTLSIPIPAIQSASNIAQTAFDANWQAVSGATTYYLDVSDDVNFNNLIVNDQNVGNVTSHSVSSGLTCNTAYYYRVRAENACGVGSNSGTETLTTSSCPWTCGDALTDTRDTKTYGTVLIGNQCWMEENLAYLPAVHNNTQFKDQGDNAQAGYGVYGYNGLDVTTAEQSQNYLDYGVLYNWYAAMYNGSIVQSSSNNNPSNVQGVCPTGWHLPSDAEWQELESHLGMLDIDTSATQWRGSSQGIGTQLKSTTGWNSGNNSNNNTSGFTALPGGQRSTNGSFNSEETYGFWWSATESSSSRAWRRDLFHNNAGVFRFANYMKEMGSSVRCVRD